MSHCTVQYVKPLVKIGMPGSAEMPATARMLSTIGKTEKAEPPATDVRKEQQKHQQEQERQQ